MESDDRWKVRIRLEQLVLTGMESSDELNLRRNKASQSTLPNFNFMLIPGCPSC